MSKLLPYETILKAREGDPEAVNAVLLHYDRYIRYFSKMNGQVNAEVEDYVKQRLIDCQFKFRLDDPPDKPKKLNTSRPPAASKSSKSEKDLLLFLHPFWQNGQRGSVSGKQGNFLSVRLPFPCFQYYREWKGFSPVSGRNRRVRCHFSESGQKGPLQDLY